MITSALARLGSEAERLVELDSANSYSKYERFQLLDEGGVRPGGEVVQYAVPRKTEPHIAIPTAFFTNGWVYTLEDSEILLLLMLMALQGGDSSPWVKVEERERLIKFGIGREAYSAHETLRMFGLIDTLAGIGRRPNGTVENFSGISGDTPLHEFVILYNGLELPAEREIIEALKELQSHRRT
ncbi:hypothetical protein [Nonomuraea sp. NPDC050786]|uniref:hypothetical protein n=1 Tax=Nonomuraea sp. NPDC050786 TaxID=3154840 RepID=UPI00340088B7